MRTDVTKSQPESPHRVWLQRVLQIHSELVRSLEWSGSDLSTEQLLERIPLFVRQICERDSDRLSGDEEEAMINAVISETVGLGPLDSLLNDPIVSDILVNRSDEVFIERKGRLIRTPLCFANDDHLMRIIQRIAGRVGRRIDESSPMVDARLEDGSRVHAVVRPLALHGPTLSIRRFGTTPIGIDDLLAHGSLTQQMVDLLSTAVKSRVSFLISGGTGAGKTTLLNAISSFIPLEERIVTIEDAAELKLQHPHVISLETRPSNAEEKGKVTIRDLVRTSLRMRPDRILVGEVRGDEVIDMLQAMNTGHPGSLSTVHANSTKDALSRLEVMVGMSGQDLPVPVLRHYVTSGIRMLVHVARLSGGARKVMQISEVLGLKNGEYKLREICGFRYEGVDEAGDAVGEFYETGYLPRFMKPTKTTSRRQSLLPNAQTHVGTISTTSALENTTAVRLPRFTIVATEVEIIENEDDIEDNEAASENEFESETSGEESETFDTHSITNVEFHFKRKASGTPLVMPDTNASNEPVAGITSSLLDPSQQNLQLGPDSSSDLMTGAIMVGVSDYFSINLVDPTHHKVDDAIETLRYGFIDEAIDSVAKMHSVPRDTL